jgi:hypothetical protein
MSGGVGVTTVLDAAVAGSSIAQAVAAGGTDSAAAETAMDSYRKLMDRLGSWKARIRREAATALSQFPLADVCH